ncbi:Methyl-accepting chemotaxis protein (MCP) signalling domain-containing protein [Verrucomicrobium sp. GAS474]|uniref:methyl-accepting chemotaxis protein n=1 Tax=Verrucomicrobium sp. GAS474 TaxID=1882831 RepID=UPI00087C762F|nr:methyl-accepting chemotaxis protein [Verrucomicrobium sp. GAS474]SDU23767.1 Methyl-accepting chemotaxis protein (MCP) signalling domain-containing protein [Verrucomicrobium sp. GAS474]
MVSSLGQQAVKGGVGNQGIEKDRTDRNGNKNGFAKLSLGKKIFFGFSLLLVPLVGLGLFMLHSLKSIQDATVDLRSENLPAIEVSKRLGKASADLLNAATRLSLTLDPVDSAATLAALDATEKELAAIQADPALASTPAAVRLLPPFEASFRSFAGTAVAPAADAAAPDPAASPAPSAVPPARQGGDFAALDSGISAMRDARETLDDTQQNFLTLLGKIASAQRDKLRKDQDSSNTNTKVAARLELIDAILDKTAHVASETNRNIARQDAEAIAATAKEFDDVLPMIDQLLALTPPERDWKPAAGSSVGLARKDDLSNAQSQAQVFRSFLRNFVISWKVMSKAKEKCAADLASLRTISENITAAASQGVDERSGSTLKHIGSTKFFAFAALGGTLLLALLMGQVVTRVLTDSVKAVILQIANTLSSKTEETLKTAEHFNAAGKEMERQTQRQSEAVRKTASSLSQIAASTKETAVRARQARDMSRETRSAAESGEEAMRTMNAAAEEVRASGEHLRTAMGELREFSKGISQAFRQIDAIALQTRILSLNASVEAARAGHHGAGFAVVADEVRNLSHRSTEASRNSGSKVELALQKVEEGVKTSEEALLRIEAILESASRVDGHLRSILDHARNTDTVMEAIAVDSAQQSEGLQVISEASKEIDTITQNNAEAARQTASAANHLREQAAEVRKNVQELVGMVEETHRERPLLPVNSPAQPPTAPAPYRKAFPKPPSRAALASV